MRKTSMALALAALLALAGCLGGDDPETDPTPTPTDATPTPTASTPATPTEPTPDPTPTTPTPTPTSPTPTPTPTTPAPLPPKVVANQSFDFATEGDASGQSPKTKPTDAVPEGYTQLVLNVTLTRTSAQLPGSVAVNAPTVRIIAPDGTEALVTQEEGLKSVTVAAQPGAWTVRYEGSGTVKAQVVATALA